MRAWLAGSVALLGLWSASAGARASLRTPGCVPPTLNVSAALAEGRVTVSPAPHSRDAAAGTQLSFRGVPATELSRIVVSGSRSGRHVGRLLAYSQGDGASFVPLHRFKVGERVTVAALLSQAGREIPFAWSFTVAVPDSVHSAAPATRPRALRRGDLQSFRSRPDLRPPSVAATVRSPAATPGELFLAPYSGPGQYGPMILDQSGRLLWFKALPRGARAADFRVQSYEGRPVLTWWQSPLLVGRHRGAGIVIADTAYRQIATVRAGNGYQPDLHEFQITPQGTALITIYNAIRCDTAAVGGPRDGAVADSIVQEIDLASALVRFEWHSLDHVALGDSYSSARPTGPTLPFDFFHINSIEVQQSGGLLIDARDTWAAYAVDRASGRVSWTLGGKHSSFAMGPGTRTAFQHDAREQPDGTITFFDNGASPQAHPQSRAIAVRLDRARMTATLVRRAEHPARLLAGSQGNTQALPGGGWLVGWGELPYFSEFSASGQLLLDAHLPPGYESYRAFRQPWSGQPLSSPAVSVRRAAHGRLAVSASWNGATRVAAWRVLEGARPSSLLAVAQGPRTGFETTLAAPASSAYLAVEALDADGAILGSSSPRAIPK